ncbi:Flagellar biosynthesis protein fliT [Georgfuchsia toluolica]|uniref:Flagellar protein FliT n=1 Tax=Georgfuchsia toluolica TaxID=424218 RepID=A0A916J2R9_9PROT|nr:flagellar protein FliT [Georgfuchsia toluolica]CAG4882206.1 Flagellar biosynthesis protein fliT [Georgfuchsia toluolica]
MMQIYETLKDTSCRMLAAARNSEWDLLVRLELDCRKLIDELPDAGDGRQLDEAQLGRRREIIRRILADDAAIRDLVEPWMARTRQFLTSLALERKLGQSYPQDCAP